jgi:riboflavin biosynthesis pyrimidine reductase
MRQLLPSPDRPITIAEAYAAPLGTRSDRPWVGLSMVASIDGSTVLDGASGGLSSENDIGVLSRLRQIADVVVVGSSTVAGEGYGPPKKPGQRIGVLTRSGDVDTNTELFTSGSGFIITTTRAEISDDAIDVIRAGDDDIDLHAAIASIPDLCPGAAFVQAEGGPTVNGAFTAADLFDEMNITTSPATIGGAGPRLVHDGPDVTHRFELEQLLIDDQSFVFSRWRRLR